MVSPGVKTCRTAPAALHSQGWKLGVEISFFGGYFRRVTEKEQSEFGPETPAGTRSERAVGRWVIKRYAF